MRGPLFVLASSSGAQEVEQIFQMNRVYVIIVRKSVEVELTIHSFDEELKIFVKISQLPVKECLSVSS